MTNSMRTAGPHQPLVINAHLHCHQLVPEPPQPSPCQISPEVDPNMLPRPFIVT